MKKTLLLLLCSVAIVIFSSCNDDSNNNGGTTPPVDTVDTTAKPKLGYIDFNHWYDIIRKDMATVKPLIRGTYVKDSTTNRGKVKILIYNQESDCGTFTTQYHFDSDNILGRIYAFVASERDSTVLKTPAEVMKHGKIISDEMNTFTQSFNDGQDRDRGRYLNGRLQMKKNNVYVPTPEYKKEYNQVKYKMTWEYIDEIIARGIDDDESIRSSEMWAIRDENENPDALTPEISTSVSFASYAECDTIFSGRHIDVQFLY